MSPFSSSNGVVGNDKTSSEGWLWISAALPDPLGVKTAAAAPAGSHPHGSEFIGIEHGPDAGAFENLPDGSDVQQSLRTALGQCKILNGKFPSFCQ